MTTPAEFNGYYEHRPMDDDTPVCAQCGQPYVDEGLPCQFNGYCTEYCEDAAKDDLDAGQGDPEEYHDDTPHLEDGIDNCDDCGTGEGRYHGRI